MIIYRLTQLFLAFMAFTCFGDLLINEKTMKRQILMTIVVFMVIMLLLLIEWGIRSCLL